MSAAPDFPADATWLNTVQPLGLHAELRGHVVVLLVWTASSIHCVHAQQAMLFVAARFAGRPFAAIGVYQPRLAGERAADAVRATVRQLDIRHPVLVDAHGEFGRALGASAWPTLVLLDAQGAIRFRGAGEPDRDRLADAVDALLREGSDCGALASEPLRLRAEAERGGGALRFPTGLAIDAERGWLWIADTGHHRLVAVDARSGAARAVVGSGIPGFADGAHEVAAFFGPRGLAVADGALFVADTGNHALRRVDLAKLAVATLAGDGRPSGDRAGGRAGRRQGLRLPGALAALDGALFVAMTGLHQLWRVDPQTGLAQAIAGNGRAHLQDGTGTRAGLAQPEALATRGGTLFVADAGAGAVRAFEPAGGALRTLARDRWQHPAGLAVHGDDLLIADAFGAAVARMRGEAIDTLLSPDDGLRRPTGLAVLGDTLFVGDAHAHAVVCVDLRGGAARPLAIGGLEAPRSPAAPAAPVAVRAMSDVTLRIPVRIAPGERLHPDVPMRLRCENEQGYPLLVDVDASPELEHDRAVLYGLPFSEAGEGTFRMRLSWLTCIDRDAACHPHELEREVAVVLDPHADADLELDV
jgi:sugar lactone lactonase YvrE